MVYQRGKRLAEAAYPAGDNYSAADMAVFPRLRNDERRGINLPDYPRARQWFDAINAHPAVVSGLQELSDANNSVPRDEKSRDILIGNTQFARR
jgi:hypothetical protein